MSLFKPKSKIILNETLKSDLDSFDVDDGKGSSVYKHKKEEKKTTFADVIGDDVFFEGEVSSSINKGKSDKGINSEVKDSLIGLMVLIGIVAFAISLFFVIFKYIV